LEKYSSDDLREMKLIREDVTSAAEDRQ